MYVQNFGYDEYGEGGEEGVEGWDVGVEEEVCEGEDGYGLEVEDGGGGVSPLVSFYFVKKYPVDEGVCEVAEGVEGEDACGGYEDEGVGGTGAGHTVAVLVEGDGVEGAEEDAVDEDEDVGHGVLDGGGGGDGKGLVGGGVQEGTGVLPEVGVGLAQEGEEGDGEEEEGEEEDVVTDGGIGGGLGGVAGGLDAGFGVQVGVVLEVGLLPVWGEGAGLGAVGVWDLHVGGVRFWRNGVYWCPTVVCGGRGGGLRRGWRRLGRCPCGGGGGSSGRRLGGGLGYGGCSSGRC